MAEATDRNVFILGAGFSAHAGAPLIQGFLDKAREFMDDPASELEPFEREHFKRAFEFRREMAQAREKVTIDLDNIEELFGLVEISQRLGERQRETRDSIVYLIAKTLQLAIRPPGPERNEVRYMVGPALKDLLGSRTRDKVIRQLEQVGPRWCASDIYELFAAISVGIFDDLDRKVARTNTFITFNYDLVLDHALQRLGVSPDYHLKAARTNQNVLGRQESSLLLKLHGSTNWGVCGNCLEDIVVLQGKIPDNPLQFQMEKCSQCGAQKFQPLLIPPSWDKSEYQKIMTPVWARAVAELKLATRICIIGYSMPASDLFFKYLLTVALAQNHCLYKLIVVDLASKPLSSMVQSIPRKPCDLEERYRKLLDPLFRERCFTFADNGFEGFFGGTSEALSILGRGEGVSNIGN